jgi:hypothetical protein
VKRKGKMVMIDDIMALFRSENEHFPLSCKAEWLSDLFAGKKQPNWVGFSFRPSG